MQKEIDAIKGQTVQGNGGDGTIKADVKRKTHMGKIGEIHYNQPTKGDRTIKEPPHFKYDGDSMHYYWDIK